MNVAKLTKRKGAKLTLDNYYTSKNKALTRSKTEDFKKSKEYFYKKHIAHTLTTKPSGPMKIGSTIDDLLSGQPLKYQQKVLKRDHPELWQQQKENPDSVMTERELDTALSIAEHAKAQPFYEWYERKGAKFQVILEADYHSPAAEKPIHIAGVADIITEDGDTLYIDDFKYTADSNNKSLRSWYYKCKDSGYFRQLGLYKEMAKVLYPKAKRIVCRHIVMSRTMDDLVRINLYEMLTPDLTEGAQQFFDAVDGIVSCDAWVDDPIAWDATQALTLG